MRQISYSSYFVIFHKPHLALASTKPIFRAPRQQQQEGMRGTHHQANKDREASGWEHLWEPKVEGTSSGE